jgi:hypothetical protein
LIADDFGGGFTHVNREGVIRRRHAYLSAVIGKSGAMITGAVINCVW